MSTDHPQTYRLLEHILFPPAFVKEERLKRVVKGKTVLITGASFGIGACLARKLGKTTAHLILVGRTSEKLHSIREAIIADGGSAQVFSADLREDQEMTDLLAFLQAQPRLDVLVSNAGKSIRRPLAKSLDRYHDFSRTMAINYEAPVKLLLALLPKLSQNKGQIINISALNVLMAPAPYWAAYQASKTAFDQWLRCSCAEIEKMGVVVTSIYLPLVRTRMIVPTKIYRSMPAMNPEHVANIICQCMLSRKRTYKPWWSLAGEVASVLFRRTWEWLNRKYIVK